MEIRKQIGSKAKYHHLDLRVTRLKNDQYRVIVKELGRTITDEVCSVCSETTAHDKATAVAYGHLQKHPSGIKYEDHSTKWEPVFEGEQL